jgi:DNA (cytosine-5)-methyltransferase 1
LFSVSCVASRRPDEEEDAKARCHYRSAKVDGIVYALDDDVYVMVLPNPAFLDLRFF